MRPHLGKVILLGLAMVAPLAAAHATPFGNATASFNFNGPISAEPTFAFGATNGTLSLGDSTTIASSTGALSAATGGTSSGVLTFSMNVGTTRSQSTPSAFTFTDGTSTYTFDLQSVETVTAGDNGDGTSSISLYLLGQLGTTGLQPSTTSIVVNYIGNNSTGREVNDNLALSNPPATDPNPPSGTPVAAVPEPISLALLAGGLASTILVRRNRRA